MFTHESESTHGLQFQSKQKDFSRTQAITYTVHMALSEMVQATDVVTGDH